MIGPIWVRADFQLVVWVGLVVLGPCDCGVGCAVGGTTGMLIHGGGGGTREGGTKE